MSRRRLVVGANEGMTAWAGQLISAVMMIIVTAYLLLCFLVIAPSGHAEVSRMVGSNYFRVPVTFGAIMLIWHAWLGGKSILMDYIKWAWLRVVKYIALVFYLALVLIWFLGVIWSL